MSTQSRSLISLLLLLAAGSSSLLSSPNAAEDSAPPAHETFIGILDKASTGDFRLQVEQPDGKSLTYPIDAAGAVLIGDQLAAQTKPGTVVLVKAAGRLEQGVLHVTTIEDFHELVGWLSTRDHHAAGHDPRSLTQDALKPDVKVGSEYGLAAPGAGGGFGFYIFDAKGQASAAALVKNVAEAGGLQLLVNGALRDDSIQVARILRERSFTGYVVTASFVAEDRPLKDLTREYLLDSGHASTGYGYFVNSCGGYEYFPFDRQSRDRIRELLARSPKSDHIKFVVKGFDFWRDRTTKVTEAREDVTPDAPVEATVNGLVSTRNYYLQNRLQLSHSPGTISRDFLLAPANAATGYGIVYKPCCRFGFYRTDEAGRALLANLVKNSATASNIKVIAKGVLDLDFIKLTSVEEDTGAGPAASYPLKGRIVNVLPDESSLLIKHEAIPGFMAAMTMSFRVDPKVLQTAKKGQAITATLRVKNDDFWLEDVKFLP